MSKLIPEHVAIIMDGNGRWAKEQNRPRTDGHSAAKSVIMQVIKYASDNGIKELSLFAFSTENWLRPKEEVAFLMNYAREVLHRQIEQLNKWNVRVRWLGRKPKMWRSVLKVLTRAEQITEKNNGLVVNFCINYGSRLEIVDAVNDIISQVKQGKLKGKITEKSLSKHLYSPDMLPVDLLIRTSGENRISNFLLWQSAYAELIWVDKLWPDFTNSDFESCLSEFAKRNRRFGKV